MCEAVAIYGVIMAIILQGKMNKTEMYDNNYPELVFAGYALFWTGITVGFSNLACGYVTANVASAWASLGLAVRLLTPRIPTALSRSWWWRFSGRRWACSE